MLLLKSKYRHKHRVMVEREGESVINVQLDERL